MMIRDNSVFGKGAINVMIYPMEDCLEEDYKKYLHLLCQSDSFPTQQLSHLLNSVQSPGGSSVESLSNIYLNFNQPPPSFIEHTDFNAHAQVYGSLGITTTGSRLKNSKAVKERYPTILVDRIFHFPKNLEIEENSNTLVVPPRDNEEEQLVYLNALMQDFIVDLLRNLSSVQAQLEKKQIITYPSPNFLLNNPNKGGINSNNNKSLVSINSQQSNNSITSADQAQPQMQHQPNEDSQNTSNRNLNEFNELLREKKRLTGRVWKIKGDFQLMMGNYRQARQFYEQSVSESRQTGDSLFQSSAIDGLLAIEYYQTSTLNQELLEQQPNLLINYPFELLQHQLYRTVLNKSMKLSSVDWQKLQSQLSDQQQFFCFEKLLKMQKYTSRFFQFVVAQFFYSNCAVSAPKQLIVRLVLLLMNDDKLSGVVNMKQRGKFCSTPINQNEIVIHKKLLISRGIELLKLQNSTQSIDQLQLLKYLLFFHLYLNQNPQSIDRLINKLQLQSIEPIVCFSNPRQTFFTYTLLSNDLFPKVSVVGDKKKIATSLEKEEKKLFIYDAFGSQQQQQKSTQAHQPIALIGGEFSLIQLTIHNSQQIPIDQLQDIIIHPSVQVIILSIDKQAQVTRINLQLSPLVFDQQNVIQIKSIDLKLGNCWYLQLPFNKPIIIDSFHSIENVFQRSELSSTAENLTISIVDGLPLLKLINQRLINDTTIEIELENVGLKSVSEVNCDHLKSFEVVGDQGVLVQVHVKKGVAFALLRYNYELFQRQINIDLTHTLAGIKSVKDSEEILEILENFLIKSHGSNRRSVSPIEKFSIPPKSISGNLIIEGRNLNAIVGDFEKLQERQRSNLLNSKDSARLEKLQRLIKTSNHQITATQLIGKLSSPISLDSNLVNYLLIKEQVSVNVAINNESMGVDPVHVSLQSIVSIKVDVSDNSHNLILIKSQLFQECIEQDGRISVDIHDKVAFRGRREFIVDQNSRSCQFHVQFYTTGRYQLFFNFSLLDHDLSHFFNRCFCIIVE